MPTKKAAKKSGTKKLATKRPRSLTVGTGRHARLPELVREMEKALGRIGCEGCRSGLDKIVLGDRVINRIR
jgi:hypothetical protein